MKHRSDMEIEKLKGKKVRLIRLSGDVFYAAGVYAPFSIDTDVRDGKDFRHYESAECTMGNDLLRAYTATPPLPKVRWKRLYG